MALAAIAMAPVPAFAADPPAAATVPPPGAVLDPASLTIARQIVDVVMPPDRRLAMTHDVETAMLSAMRGNLAVPAGVDDPSLKAIITGWLDSMPAQLDPVMAQQLPAVAEAFAHAYVRAFTRDELVQILAFAHTPAGSKYLSRSAALMQDPDVHAVMVAVDQQAQKAAMASVPVLQGRIVAYIMAHPDVAAKLKAARAGAAGPAPARPAT